MAWIITHTTEVVPDGRGSEKVVLGDPLFTPVNSPFHKNHLDMDEMLKYVDDLEKALMSTIRIAQRRN